MRAAHPASFWLTAIWYGNGFPLVAVMGGMWSLFAPTYFMILRTAARSVCSVACRTFALSVPFC